jgi:hypothetical protein
MNTTHTVSTGWGLTGTMNPGLLGTTITPSNNTISVTNTLDSYNLSNMENNSSQPHQVKVAVFEVEHNDKLTVVSTHFIGEFWIEQKPKTDLKMAVAKKLDKEKVDFEKIVIKELIRVSF